MSNRRKLIDELCNADHRTTDRALRDHADVVTIEVIQLLDPERECPVKLAVRRGDANVNSN